MLPNSPKLFQSMTISWGNLLVQAFGFLRSPHHFAFVADALNLLYRDYINGLNECLDRLQRRLLTVLIPLCYLFCLFYNSVLVQLKLYCFQD